MHFYLAPMEGITGYIYRNAHNACFGTIDTYVAPFISPNKNRCMNTREAEDVKPEHNKDMRMVPQILTNKAERFIDTAKELHALGYDEVNLNLGCPSGTVVSKKKGAGFLEEPMELQRFFEHTFDSLDGIVKISVKTRLGMEFKEEFEDLLPIFNEYPFTELIVHPRLRRDFYNGSPDWECFRMALEYAKMPVCYNGDIFTVEAYEQFVKRFPTVERMMLGRGILRNPNLIGAIRGEGKADKQRLREFHDRLLKDYGAVLSGERNLLFKMKELWFYFGNSFEEPQRYLKKIKKAQRVSDYKAAVDALFREAALV